MKDLVGLSYDEMHEVFKEWNSGELNSYLIEITRDILAVKDEDGSPLDAGQVAKIDVLATESLGTSANSWSKLAISPILENGQLRFEAPMEPAQPRRFFKVQERP